VAAIAFRAVARGYRAAPAAAAPATE
jgi:hypothetical protein